MIAAVSRLGLALILLIAGNLPAYGETIDEVVAAVANTPILRSDLDLAVLVHLTDAVAGESPDDFGRRLLEARIRLELEFRDLEASGTLYRLDLDVGPAHDLLVARAGGDDALEASMAAHGLTDADIDELALRLAAVDAYVEQRLRPRVRVTADDVRSAYESLIVTPAHDAGEDPPPFESVRDRLHRLLVERGLNDEIEQWLESAAEQHEVTRFHLR